MAGLHCSHSCLNPLQSAFHSHAAVPCQGSHELNWPNLRTFFFPCASTGHLMLPVQFLFLHLRDTTTGCFFLDFSDSPAQVFICVVFLLPPESVAAFHVLMAIHLVACPLSPYWPHPPSWLQWPQSKPVTSIHNVSLMAFHACWMLPHRWPTNPLTLSHLNQNLLVLPCTDSLLSAFYSLPYPSCVSLILDSGSSFQMPWAHPSCFLGRVLHLSCPQVGCPLLTKGKYTFDLWPGLITYCF